MGRLRGQARRAGRGRGRCVRRGGRASAAAHRQGRRKYQPRGGRGWCCRGVSAQDVQQVLGLDSSVKVTLPKMDGFGDYTVTVTLHKQVKVELPLKLVEA